MGAGLHFAELIEIAMYKQYIFTENYTFGLLAINILNKIYKNSPHRRERPVVVVWGDEVNIFFIIIFVTFKHPLTIEEISFGHTLFNTPKTLYAATHAFNRILARLIIFW